ncbi:hypothetical protein [Ktedonobacter racemifer]|uniref:Uncharacterized protein n=1 Tax=Ktedonobacter racemifer DSM 44963 TaxID=485913 RepID=D6TCT6_KTERA|nr:hypothetical protein [Ktedonobacter racemifer]EFH88200.1 hypothetical protein Krac_9613 [Ktedonobacter racemifer DSM 44963]
MSDPNRENQPQDEIGLKLVRRDWTIYDDQTQRMLERMLTCYGEAAAQWMSQAIWLELNLRESAATQCIERLQRQLDDTRVVLHLQEQELARLKATKGRKRIQELEQRCSELEEALARKPVEEAAKRAELVDGIFLSGEKIEFQTLFSDEGVLVEQGWDGYCTFCNTASPERLKMVKEAITLVLHGRKGRKRLEALG